MAARQLPRPSAVLPSANDRRRAQLEVWPSMRGADRRKSRPDTAVLARMLLLGGVLVLAFACRTPVGVKRVDARAVHRAITANVLTTGEPSPPAIQALNRSDLAERFEDDPEGALAELRERYLADPESLDLSALAELAFVHAENGGGRPWFLASAVYAYAFLFPGAGGRPPDPFDPRLRLAADLYNRGLTQGLALESGDEVDLSPRTMLLPFGELVLESKPEGFLWV